MTRAACEFFPSKKTDESKKRQALNFLSAKINKEQIPQIIVNNHEYLDNFTNLVAVGFLTQDRIVQLGSENLTRLLKDVGFADLILSRKVALEESAAFKEVKEESKAQAPEAPPANFTAEEYESWLQVVLNEDEDEGDEEGYEFMDYAP